MTTNGFLFFSYFLLVSLILSFTCHATSPFGFIHKLEGCHKGNKTKEIHQLKNYLQQFGYLDNQTNSNNEDFDDALEEAVKIYQKNYHLKSTGKLDTETVSQMIAPRCGVPDIVNGINFMQAGNKKHDSNNFHTMSHYTFFSGNPKWSTLNLTYGFSANTPTAAMAAVDYAFAQWDSATAFTFRRALSGQTPNMLIGFFVGNHGDGYPFDGPGGTLAHAFAPQNGRFHYDGAENWATGAVPNAFDLQTVAIHEIGHLLGLGHSSVLQAVMYPSVSAGQTKGLNTDDINGIKALYNI